MAISVYDVFYDRKDKDNNRNWIIKAGRLHCTSVDSRFVLFPLSDFCHLLRSG